VDAYEVEDSKVEAKTSQALREGLDVRATKSAANSLMDKKKKSTVKSPKENNSADDNDKDNNIEPHTVTSTSTLVDVAKSESETTSDEPSKEKEMHEEKAVASPAGVSDAS